MLCLVMQNTTHESGSNSPASVKLPAPLKRRLDNFCRRATITKNGFICLAVEEKLNSVERNGLVIPPAENQTNP